MKLEIILKENPVNLMRRAGYIYQRNDGAEMSFTRPLASSGYPRFHIYAKRNDLKLEISIHLDQKKNTYGEETRHHGEYENEGPLKEEVERLKKIFSND